MLFKNDDIGKLIIRLTLGLLLVLHGLHKLMHPEGSIGFITSLLSNYNLPAFIAYGVYIGEVIAPLMVISGFYTRLGAFLIVGNMCFALMLAHTNEFFTMTKMGAWSLELQGFFLFSALALMFLGSGKYAIKHD